MSNHKNELVQQVAYEVRRFIAGAILFNQQIADRIGMNLTDLQVLHLLQLAEAPMTPGRLARLTGLTSGGVTVALDRLETGGFIKRRPNPDDRRSLIVQIIPSSIRKFEPHYRAVGEGLDRILRGTDATSLETIRKFFQQTNAASKQE
jgi:DNA-binding MarR family transcriptional regulator